MRLNLYHPNFNIMKIYLVVLIFLFFSCTSSKNAYQERVDLIKNEHYEIFFGVNIDSRMMENEKFIYPDYLIENNNKNFLLPNFLYFKCRDDLSCIERSSDKKYDIYEYSRLNNVSDKDAVKFVYQQSVELNIVFNRLNIKSVVSNNITIGKCIIFFPNAKEFIAYVPNSKEIKNVFWKEKFTKKNQIYENWFAGVY